MRSALWYFDFVSPFAYICLHRLKELPADLRIEYRPVLFAGLLGHWGQKGPAEIASKRRYTYRWCNWWAQRLAIPFRFPAGHPFNPLHHLRLAIACGSTPEVVRRKNDELHEQNPMLGHRGCRLAVTYPEIYETQVIAIARAAAAAHRDGIRVLPEIMIPIVGMESELARLVALVRRSFDGVAGDLGIAYTVGTMVELPRACLVADRLAAHADFFSFGTNDLTQTAFGFSRDDIGRFLPTYLGEHLLERDPFAVLDETGVGALMRLGIDKGRGEKPKLKIGICGEHGGDPRSVEFCHRIGLDYVSCSPFRVPIARVAAAQAALREAGLREGQGVV